MAVVPLALVGASKKGTPSSQQTRQLLALSAFVRITLNRLRSFLQGNPVYEAGGTVAVRDLEVPQ
jgi:hypothetical protein